MYWSNIIWKMYRFEGKTIQEIIDYFDKPLINKEYILRVLENVMTLKKKPPRRKNGWKKTLMKSIPKPGTQIRIVWDKVESIGGLPAFMELLKEKQLIQLSKEWNVPAFYISNFKRAFVHGRIQEAHYRTKVRTLMKKRNCSSIKKEHSLISDKAKKLW